MSTRMLVMASCTKVNGTKRLEKETVSAFSSGLMAPNMKACGRKTKPMVKEE